MNEDKFEDSIAKGDRARILFNETIIQDFFTIMEKNIIEGIKNSDYEDKEGRENLYRIYKTLDAFKKHFERYISEGKVANDFLAKLRAGAFDNL